LPCIEADIPVVPVTGANAGLTALIASGICSHKPFYFYGFLPRKKKDTKWVGKSLNCRSETLILYESPAQVKRSVKKLLTVFGPDGRWFVVARLTKRYEEFIRGTIEEDVSGPRFRNQGEFCLIIERNSEGSLMRTRYFVEKFIGNRTRKSLMEEKENYAVRKPLKLVAKSEERVKQRKFICYFS